MMTLESTDIRFECSQCGQHLVVDAAGAGLTADCPICETSVTVPKASSRAAGSFSEVQGGLSPASAGSPEVVPERPLAHPERAAYIDPSAETLREELIDASLLNGRLERQLDASGSDLARLQQQLKAATEECERLTASATHTQAELKTFQNERQQLKTDLTSARQRCTALETQLGEREAGLADAQRERTELSSQLTAAGEQLAAREGEISATTIRSEQLALQHAAAQEEVTAHRATIAELQHERETLGGHFTATGELLADSQRHLAQRDEELAQLRTENEARVSHLDDTLGKMRQDLEAAASERAELRRQLDEALPLVEEGRKNRSQLSQTEDELLSTLEKLQASETTAKTLQQDLDTQRQEIDTLRKDLAVNDAGRELLELRERLTQAEAERERAQARAGILETDLQGVRTAQESLERHAESLRQDHQEAVQKLTAISQTKVMQDNEVLRGIVARQNSELAQQHGELYRLKRARFVLKIVYTAFGLGLLGVVAFACKVLAHVKL